MKSVSNCFVLVCVKSIGIPEAIAEVESFGIGVQNDVVGDMDGLFCSTMMPLWTNAATLLKQPGPSNCSSVYLLYNRECEPPKEIVLRVTGSVKKLLWVVQWKVASSQLRSVFTTANQNSFREAGQPDGHVPFSFVREPLAHFASGYSEIEFLKIFLPVGAPKKECGGTYQSVLDVDERVKMFVHDFLNSHLNNHCIDNWHVWPMIGPLRKAAKYGPIAFIGRLESLDEDWVRLQDVVGVTYPTVGKAVANQTTVLDDRKKPYRSAMQKLLENSRGNVYLLALACAALLPDYVCFGYSSPVPSDQCVNAGFARDLHHWTEILAAIRHSLCIPQPVLAKSEL